LYKYRWLRKAIEREKKCIAREEKKRRLDHCGNAIKCWFWSLGSAGVATTDMKEADDVSRRKVI